MTLDDAKANQIAAEQVRHWLWEGLSPAEMILALGCVPFRATLKTAHVAVLESIDKPAAFASV